MSGECLRTDLTTWEIGPYHGALPGAMRLLLQLDGEIIVTARVETGYMHRGLEKALERHAWQSSVIYADHLDPEGAAFGELVTCLAVEEMAEIAVPDRAKVIRMMLSELTRISSHFGYVVRVSRAVGADTLAHYVLRDREKLLDLFELLTGARYSVGFFRYGGVCADITDGFIERVVETCDLLRLRFKEYNDLLTFNQGFLKRVSGVGRISPEQAISGGVTGPNARAAGLSFDVRRAHPYSGYERTDFDIPVGRGEAGTTGDAHDRFLLRLREISQSVRILQALSDAVPKGDFCTVKIDREFCVPVGEAYARVESARGLLACHIISDGGPTPARIQYRTPSGSHLGLIPEIIRGHRIEDLPVLLSSLDLSVAEADK